MVDKERGFVNENNFQKTTFRKNKNVKIRV